MISVVCYVLAALMFLVAGANQTVLSQPQPDEIAWGLFLVVIAWLFGGIGPRAPWVRE